MNLIKICFILILLLHYLSKSKNLIPYLESVKSQDSYIQVAPYGHNKPFPPAYLLLPSISQKIYFNKNLSYGTSINHNASAKVVRRNELIDEPQIRLVDSQSGKMLGIIDTDLALKEAKSLGLDLVEISKGVLPPVCKILNYSKFQYKKEKEEKLKALKQRSQGIKEIHLTSGIADNDIKIKCKNAERFLKSGNQVKFIFFLKRRERSNSDIVTPIIQAISDQLYYIGLPQKPNASGSLLIVIFRPKSQKSKAQVHTQDPNKYNSSTIFNG